MAASGTPIDSSASVPSEGRVAGPTTVLFLCVHNSARSQMAEGILSAWGGDRFLVRSAGLEATEVRPLAVRTMAEIGIDISGNASKTVAAFEGMRFDYAVTVCDDATEACPYFPTADNQRHWSFDDPSAAEGTEEQRTAVYRRVRDEIARRIEREFGVHRGGSDAPSAAPSRPRM